MRSVGQPGRQLKHMSILISIATDSGQDENVLAIKLWIEWPQDKPNINLPAFQGYHYLPGIFKGLIKNYL